MSFINKSVNYSQTVLLKKQLAELLTTYNNKQLAKVSSDPFANTNYHLIPNNNVKYFLYITSKSTLENCHEQYNTLYFFPQNDTDNVHTEFVLEIDKVFDNLLFEGYMYNKDGMSSFLITDVLARNGTIVDCDYTMRHVIVNEILLDSRVNSKGSTIQIGIHPVLINSNMMEIFLGNFKYKDSIIAVEKITNVGKKQSIEKVLHKQDSCKLVEKGTLSDVYHVLDKNTMEKEGVLYVKGIRESQSLKNLFSKSETKSIQIECKYNYKFNKWEPIGLN